MLKSKIELFELKTEKMIEKINQKFEMFILKSFKSSNDNKDKYHTADLINIFKKNGLVISDNKITSFLNILGIGKYNKNITINSKIARGFTNIKYIGRLKMSLF